MNVNVGDIIVSRNNMSEYEILNINENLIKIADGNYIRWIEIKDIEDNFYSAVGKVIYTKTFFGITKRKVIYN